MSIDVKTSQNRSESRSSPWFDLYGLKPRALDPIFSDCLTMLQACVRNCPSAPAIRYFDGVLTYDSVYKLSTALALKMADLGVRRGDRVAIILQNIPQFPLSIISCWMLGAIPVPCNPMNSERELIRLFKDAEPRLVVCQLDRAALVQACCETIGLPTRSVMTTSPRLYQTRNDRRVLEKFAGNESFPPGAAYVPIARQLETLQPAGDSAGLLLYTSGTTGQPKGALLPHSALAYNAETSRIWFDVADASSILALAPLFHITGFVCHFCTALRTCGTLVLTYRFRADVVLDAIRECKPQFTIGAITAFNALMSVSECNPRTFACFRSVYSGGAPISPALIERFFSRTGKRIKPAYGMTETCAPTHVVPDALVPPVDSNSGAYSIGIPTSGVEARIVDDDGSDLCAGQAGELLVRGPQLMSGYWRREDETLQAMAGGWLRTGDVAVMDERGWFYIVDRKKDVIIASGFKVWPREVEDVIYLFPGIREVAVVGIPDDYRGETVKACVSSAEGAEIDPAALITFCRERLAAYKIPRIVDILPDLPKTPTGKIIRSALRPQEPK